MRQMSRCRNRKYFKGCGALNMRTNANALTCEINVLMYEEERLDYVLEIVEDGNGKTHLQSHRCIVQTTSLGCLDIYRRIHILTFFYIFKLQISA